MKALKSFLLAIPLLALTELLYVLIFMAAGVAIVAINKLFPILAYLLFRNFMLECFAVAIAVVISTVLFDKLPFSNGVKALTPVIFGWLMIVSHCLFLVFNIISGGQWGINVIHILAGFVVTRAFKD